MHNNISLYEIRTVFTEENSKLGTMMKISNYPEWTWSEEEDKIRFICARALSGIGE